MNCRIELGKLLADTEEFNAIAVLQDLKRVETTSKGWERKIFGSRQENPWLAGSWRKFRVDLFIEKHLKLWFSLYNQSNQNHLSVLRIELQRYLTRHTVLCTVSKSNLVSSTNHIGLKKKASESFVLCLDQQETYQRYTSLVLIVLLMKWCCAGNCTNKDSKIGMWKYD